MWTFLEKIPLTLIREIFEIDFKNPSEKIKLLETPKAYSTKSLL